MRETERASHSLSAATKYKIVINFPFSLPRDVAVIHEKVEKLAAKGLVDDLANLKRARVYTYCGTNDPGHYGATVKARDFFVELSADVAFNFTVPSGHCWPQDGGWSVPCGEKNEIIAAVG